MITERGGTFSTGTSMLPRMRQAGFRLIEDGDSPYRFVWLNRPTKTTITYCEGDLITETCANHTELQTHLDNLRAFYGKLDEEECAHV